MEFKQINRFKPAISKRSLLFAGGSIWLLAGSVLLSRGIFHLIQDHFHLISSLIIGAIGGLLFYFVIFSSITTRYISRILNLKIEKPCLFSFFSWKSYLVMTLMISAGILAGTCHLIPAHELHIFFVIMSLPLLFSGIAFFFQGFRYPVEKNKSDC